MAFSGDTERLMGLNERTECGVDVPMGEMVRERGLERLSRDDSLTVMLMGVPVGDLLNEVALSGAEPFNGTEPFETIELFKLE